MRNYVSGPRLGAGKTKSNMTQAQQSDVQILVEGTESDQLNVIEWGMCSHRIGRKGEGTQASSIFWLSPLHRRGGKSKKYTEV